MSGDPPADPRVAADSIQDVDAADFEVGDIDEVVRFDVVDHGPAPGSCTSSARSTR